MLIEDSVVLEGFCYIGGRELRREHRERGDAVMLQSSFEQTPMCVRRGRDEEKMRHSREYFEESVTAGTAERALRTKRC